MENSTREARNKGVPVRAMLRWLAITVLIVLILGIIADSGSSSPVSTSNSQSSYNSLENLISDYLDDADQRLKKSKMNGQRQVKQTLRFGRRSDPWFSPSASEQISLEELQSKLYGLSSD